MTPKIRSKEADKFGAVFAWVVLGTVMIVIGAAILGGGYRLFRWVAGI